MGRIQTCSIEQAGGEIQNRAGRWGESQNAPGQNSVGESAIFDLKTAGTSVKIPLQTLPNGPVVERRCPELTPTALTVSGSFFSGQTHWIQKQRGNVSFLRPRFGARFYGHAWVSWISAHRTQSPAAGITQKHGFLGFASKETPPPSPCVGAVDGRAVGWAGWLG